MIYICIVTMNRPDGFKRCLDSILPATKKAEARIHVLMNDRYWYPYPDPHVVYHHADKNLGCAGGRHYLRESLPLSTGDIVIFLDDDLYTTDDSWLQTLIAPILDGRADIAGVEPMRVTDDHYTLPEPDNPDYVSGGWMAVSAKVFIAGVNFDTGFLNYFEDCAFGIDAQLAGFRVTGVTGVSLCHPSHPGNAEVFAKSRAYFIENYGNKLKLLREKRLVGL